MASAVAAPLPLLALGFRPFFLLAGAGAVGLVLIWVGVYAVDLPLETYYGPVGWHAHEMIFGYAAAVIAGFLLTAVRNWTERPTLHGRPLAVLATLWVAGRVLPLWPALPGWAIAAVDLAFLPCLAVVVARPIIHVRQARNYAVPLVVAVLAVANLLVHLEHLGFSETARVGLYLGVDLVVLLIAVIGGRVVPFFTERALPGAAPVRARVVEPACLVTTALFALVDPFGAPPFVVGAVSAAAAVSHAIRLIGWYDRRIWRVPLLWVLHAGYAWVIAGFTLKVGVAAGWVSPPVALHAFTAGAIGVLTLGMMARVGLGHTGRVLQPSHAVAWAFGLINLAAVVRVGGILAAAHWHRPLVVLAGGLWVAAFAIFCAYYAPILTAPRPDGRPG